MTWQEYQEAVSLLYEQAAGIGEVKRNVLIPDKVTGQNRQVDTLIELEAKGHAVRILVDAKFHSDKIDVKEVEGVLALADAVNACKAIIVCSNGWTEPAEIKAIHSNMDLRILDIDEALDLIVPDKWSLCPSCERDCIVYKTVIFSQLHEPMSLAVVGQCRECRHCMAWCWDCGMKLWLDPGETVECGCEHEWIAKDDNLYVQRCSGPAV